MNIGSILIAGVAGGLGVWFGMSIEEKFKLREKLRARKRSLALLFSILAFVLAIAVMALFLVLTSILFPENELANRIVRDVGMFTAIGFALALSGVVDRCKR